MKRVVVVVGFGRHELMGNIICKVYLTKYIRCCLFHMHVSANQEHMMTNRTDNRIEVPSCSFTFHSCSGGSRCAIWFLFMLLYLCMGRGSTTFILSTRNHVLRLLKSSFYIVMI
ncbi:uncharacterized protein LOC110430960 isoform X1 [Sorghum bicolor]|uniref:uncharacterized protein LOC110430960 isoform X1 n=1 Tax=Sorghum bicolor TaxID=4558 RepID=UPI000B424B15|nr:uncharacterized protein LOC110430960 isoform X1 [Sorghum bicolor]|eukprot:XP_021304926.1 uncharacterized protein LOC110430960 isoform X1 [Sorghum bicolor]